MYCTALNNIIKMVFLWYTHTVQRIEWRKKCCNDSMAQNHGINKIGTVIISNLSFFLFFPKSSLCLPIPESVTFIYSKARLRRFSNKKIFYYGFGVVTSSYYSSMHPLSRPSILNFSILDSLNLPLARLLFSQHCIL
jgi:hypothetical protein